MSELVKIALAVKQWFGAFLDTVLSVGAMAVAWLGPLTVDNVAHNLALFGGLVLLYVRVFGALYNVVQDVRNGRRVGEPNDTDDAKK